MGKKAREKKEKKLIGLKPEKKEQSFMPGAEKFLVWVIRLGVWLALFTPLVIDTGFLFPFVAPKTTFFLIITGIIFTAYLILLVFDFSRYRPKLNTLTVVLFVFLIVFLIASAAGINWERSFWSTYERMTGVWTMLHLFAFFILLTAVFRRKVDWEITLGVSILVGLILSLYVLLVSDDMTKGGGTIGNTSFMGTYLLFNIFFALIFFCVNFLKKGGRALFWQIFAGTSLLFMLPVLFFSGARAATGFFLIGIALFFLGYFIFSGGRVLRRAVLGLMLLFAILILFSAAFQFSFFVEAQDYFWREMQTRLVVYEKGWQGFLERPVLGWGPENFNVVFLRHFDPCMFVREACGGEIWFDRAHNIVVDKLATTGLVGTLSYLAIFITAIILLLKSIPGVADKRNMFFPVGMIVLLLAYFGQNLTVFDMINSYMVFFLSLAFIVFLTEKEKEFSSFKKPAGAKLMLVPVIIVLSFVVIWTGSAKPFIANGYIVKAINAVHALNTTQAVSAEEVAYLFEKSLDSAMDKYEAREYFSKRLIIDYEKMEPDRATDFQKLFELAEKEMEKNIEENPLDFRPHLFLGDLYLDSYRLSGDIQKVARSEEVLEKAIELSPTNQQGYWKMAEVRLIQGRNDEAIELLQKAIELEPMHGFSHQVLEQVLEKLDKK